MMNRKPDWYPGGSDEYRWLAHLLRDAPAQLSQIDLSRRPHVDQLHEIQQYLVDQLVVDGFSEPDRVNEYGSILEDVIDSLALAVENAEEE